MMTPPRDIPVLIPSREHTVMPWDGEIILDEPGRLSLITGPSKWKKRSSWFKMMSWEEAELASSHRHTECKLQTGPLPLKKMQKLAE